MSDEKLDWRAGMDPFDYVLRRKVAAQQEYRDANGVPIGVGDIFWDNNLEAVRVTIIAASVYGPPDQSRARPGTFCYPESEVAWHETERVRDGRREHFDSGPYGRLVARFEGMSAADAAAAECYSVAEYRRHLEKVKS